MPTTISGSNGQLVSVSALQQTLYITATSTGGSSDAITATFSPTLSVLTSGMTLLVRTLYVNTTTIPTFTPNSIDIAAKTIVKGNGLALVAGDIAGHWIELRYDATLDKWVLLNPATGVLPSPSVVGTARNLKMAVTAASTTATLTADEIAVSTSLGGATYKVGNLNKTLNLASTGAGGMDTGSAPASGYVAIYAIYNPVSGASALLGVNATSSIVPNVYGGANMPSGYTASALVSVWPTNASSQFVIGTQRDRKIQRVGVPIISATNTSFTAVSLSTAVPPNAISVGGFFHCITNTASGGNLDLTSDVNGVGLQPIGVGGVTGTGVSGTYENLQIITQQTIYYRTTNMSTADASVTSYSI